MTIIYPILYLAMVFAFAKVLKPEESVRQMFGTRLDKWDEPLTILLALFWPLTLVAWLFLFLWAAAMKIAGR